MERSNTQPLDTALIKMQTMKTRFVVCFTNIHNVMSIANYVASIVEIRNQDANNENQVENKVRCWCQCSYQLTELVPLKVAKWCCKKRN